MTEKLRHPRLFIALDTQDPSAAREWTDLAVKHGVGIKVGLEAYYAFSTDVLQELSERAPLFLDLKLHDIPNTVKGGLCALISNISASIITVHATGGAAMLAVAAAIQYNTPDERLDIAGVTLLTNLSHNDFRIFGCRNAGSKVLELADLVTANGCRALVCSGEEVRAVKSRYPDLWTIVPGIRLPGDDAGDQKRVLTPADAIEKGADSLVIGRSITNAKHPEEALVWALQNITNAPFSSSTAPEEASVLTSQRIGMKREKEAVKREKEAVV